ncbi:Mannosyltransferase Och1p, partial [Candida maltosa Xu316]
MNWTGPGIFTDTVFEYMNSILQSPEVYANKKHRQTIVDWKVFTGMEQPIVIDDVLVLPITSFSPDVNQMGAKSSDDEIAYVKHMFSGSWKDDGMPEME